MKKLVVLMMLVLLARVPLVEWNKIPDKTEFLRLLGNVYLEQNECKSQKARVGVMEVGKDALFFGDCVIEEVRL